MVAPLAGAWIDNTRVSSPNDRRCALSACACQVCERYTYPVGKPCRLPDKAMNSLISRAGLSKNNGADSVSYIGLILF